MFERIGNWWERLEVREQRLVMVLAFAVLATGLGYAAFMVSDGLTSLSDGNDEVRQALQTLAQRKAEIIEARTRGPEVAIGDEPTPLASYLERIGGEVGITIRAQTDKPIVTKGKYHEVALQITFNDITLEQLANFLKQVETQSPTVVTQRMYAKRALMSKEKLDRVEITVATYARTKAERDKGKAAGADAGAKP
jgi:PHD/YefM family antitoxin component YafN of YafNO toxin-antitoxin module